MTGGLDLTPPGRNTCPMTVDRRGAYTADRAAALSGVPRSTVHYWAREEILVPSVSATRVKLWSYTDLMGLRTIYWLRQTKKLPEGREVPRTAMLAIRKALRTLQELDLRLWADGGGPAVVVDRAGRVHLRATDGLIEDLEGRRPIEAEWLDLIEPFTTREATEGPNLQSPRPHLRIVPGKLAGAPHIERTRIETAAVAALADRDLDQEAIHRLYPVVSPRAVAEAIDLEEQLRRNLRAA